MNPIPQEGFAEIIKELEQKPLAVNKYRDRAGEGKSQAFLVVNRRCLPPDYSRQCWLRPKLLFHLLEFAKQYVDISYNAITVNQNYAASPHYDKNNKGNSFLVAFGSYTGGELKIHEGDLSGNHDINCKPIKADFSKILHSVTPFEGERFSLVFYNFWTPKLPTLPPYSVRQENGKYFFYRGEEKITIKTGLPHPIRGLKRNKRDYSFVREQKDIQVTFN